jgi:hypothetical protein
MCYRFWDINIQFLGLSTALCLFVFTACIAETHDDLRKKIELFIGDDARKI